MRCPKCGFISFDHLTSCAKCGRDISEVASELQGTSIKVDPPMFLGGALAALTAAEDSYEEHAMDADDEGIDFNMDMEAEEEEAPEMGAAEEEVDFSFEEETEEVQAAEEADIGPEEAEEEVLTMEEDTEEGADIELEAEPEEDSAEAEESLEELDFMGSVDDADEGGLEFDLEDFMEEADDDIDASGDDEVAEIDIDLDNEDK